MCLCTQHTASLLKCATTDHGAVQSTLDLACVSNTHKKPAMTLFATEQVSVLPGHLRWTSERIDHVAIIASCSNNSLHDWSAQQVGCTDSISHMSQLYVMLTQRARHVQVATPQHLHVDVQFLAASSNPFYLTSWSVHAA